MHVSLKHVWRVLLAKVRGGQGATHTCEGVPGHYFSPECFLRGAATYAMLGVAAEGGANVHRGEVVGKRANTRVWGHFRALFKPGMLSWGGRRICDSGSRGRRGRKCTRRRSGGKMHKRMPRRSTGAG